MNHTFIAARMPTSSQSPASASWKPVRPRWPGSSGATGLRLACQLHNLAAAVLATDEAQAAAICLTRSLRRCAFYTSRLKLWIGLPLTT